MTAAVCRPALWGGRPLGRFGLQGLGLVLQQFAGRDLKEVAEHGHRRELKADELFAADEPMAVRHGQVALRRFVEGVGGRDTLLGHELFEPQSHVEHATQDTNNIGSVKVRSTLLRIPEKRITLLRTQTETDMLHIAKEYETGVGHIEQRDSSYLVSFYGRRVRQAWAPTLEIARQALRRMAA